MAHNVLKYRNARQKADNVPLSGSIFWYFKEICIGMVALFVFLNCVTTIVDSPLLVECNEIKDKAEKTAGVPVVTIDPQWGIVRIHFNGEYCREPIELWEKRNSAWPHKIKQDSERPEHLIRKITAAKSQDNTGVRETSPLPSKKAEVAAHKIPAKNDDDGSRGRGAKQIENNLVSKSEDHHSILIMDEDVEVINNTLPNLHDEVSAAIFSKDPIQYIISIEDRFSNYIHEENAKNLYISILFTILLIGII